MSSGNKISRRALLKGSACGLALSLLSRFELQAATKNDVFWITNVPAQPFLDPKKPNRHAGIDSLFNLLAQQGLKFYRTATNSGIGGPTGMIAKNDVVLIKVNAQWKYRGATNSDLVRGLIQTVLDHPEGFLGEVVIIENGQGKGSLNCDNGKPYEDNSVHANANNPDQSFVYLAEKVFKGKRVSCRLLDGIRKTFIPPGDHTSEGYRRFEDVSYPCFTTIHGKRIELRKGIWNSATQQYAHNLKLINVPVLKTHVGSGITASLKHFYGILSMSDGHLTERHFAGLGNMCGKMVVSVQTPVLNIVDAIWVSHKSLQGYPENTTHRSNQIMAGQDPVALDFCAAKYIMYPIDGNKAHYPLNPTIDNWLGAAAGTINSRGGLYRPTSGIMVRQVTKSEAGMAIAKAKSRQA